jgi:TPR repeat protein
LKGSLNLVLATLAVFSSASQVVAQAAPKVDAHPKIMRLCADKACLNLQWVMDHYEGHEEDARATLSWWYWITNWDSNHIEFTGKTLHTVGGTNHIEATFTGKISPGGGSISGGSAAWRIGNDKSDTMAYTLVWDQNAANKVEISLPKDKTANSYRPVPPTTPQWSKMTEPEAAIDLNGQWEFTNGLDPDHYGGAYAKVSVIQLRNIVFGLTLEARPYPQPNETFLSFKLYPESSSSEYAGKYKGLDKGNKVADLAGTFRVRDPDHIEIEGAGILHRISHSSIHDIPCDPTNPSRVSGTEADLRGSIYEILEGYLIASCWYYIGAIQGNADSQAQYGASNFGLNGIPEDNAAAIYWTQKGAEQADYYAEKNLSMLFSEGAIVPYSKVRARFWGDRAFAKIPDREHDDAWKANPIPASALTKGLPCDSTTSPKTDPNIVHESGKLAFLAGDYGTSACWFTIGASQPPGPVNARSVTYLSIQHLFGFGVKTDRVLAFNLMKKAAEDGDSFAMCYLFYFYKRGTGTTPDQNQADYWFNKLWDPSTLGPRAWETVMGRGTLSDTLEHADEGIPDRNGDEVAACAVGEQEKNYRLTYNEAKQRCSGADVGPLTILSIGKAESRNSLNTPSEVYPEFVQFAR